MCPHSSACVDVPHSPPGTHRFIPFGDSTLLSSQFQDHCCHVERLAQLPYSKQRMWLWERLLQRVQMPGIQLESPGQNLDACSM